ncbi:MAG TPA: hypothetical protein VJJ79_01370 [Candidatus Nanoarchaeia archaeon]|nr:hypothetical protein [Candidatus Nanoarchaeia archaeon]
MHEVTEKPMLVMQVRPEFSIIYKANPKLKLKKEHIKTQREFLGYLTRTAKNWKEGRYFLRSNLGTFAAFYVKKGGHVTLYKENKQKIPYLCWSYFGKRKR